MSEISELCQSYELEFKFPKEVLSKKYEREGCLHCEGYGKSKYLLGV